MISPLLAQYESRVRLPGCTQRLTVRLRFCPASRRGHVLALVVISS